LGITRGLPPADFPDSCEGLVTIGGQYTISAKHIVNASRSHSCIIRAQHGTTLMLSAPLHFLGDVRITGSLQVVAQEDMRSDSCFMVKGSLTLEMDLLRMTGCRSSDRGGALQALGDLNVIGGKLVIDDCHAREGGAIFVHGTAHITGAHATFTHCTASSDVMGFISNKVADDDSHKHCGGGLAVDGSLQLQEARITFDRCHAADFGGGLYVNGSFYVESGAVNFKDCQSGRGGGMLLHCPQVGSSSCTISHSNLVFSSCSASYGGGLGLYGALGLMDSNASFENCSAKQGGGGVWVGSDSAVPSAIVANAGAFEFKQCTAGNWGGGMNFEKAEVSLDQFDLAFVGCTASIAGGGWQSGAGRLFHRRGRMSFHSCSAFGGAAFSTTLGAELAEVHVEMSSGFESEVQSAAGNLSIELLTFIYNGPRFAGLNVGVMAPNVSIKELNCTAANTCTVWAATMRIPSLLCAPGRELSRTSTDPTTTSFGCELCERGYFQPLPWRNPHCLPCPSEAQVCDAVSVTMQAGYMLDIPKLSSITDFSELDSVNRTYFCPNPASCPGGRLAHQDERAMCSPGATGKGCEYSVPGYASGDYSNPYAKFKCPTSSWAWVAAASYQFGKDALVFVLASSSVLGAKAGRKESAVLVNHFMAFGTMASHCLVALMQAKVFAAQHDFVRDFVASWGIVIDVGTGQSAAGTPLTCFYTAICGGSGLDSFFVYLGLGSVPALLLMCTLGCAKGFWLGIIVGSNCFLPAFCGRLSMLLISYRATETGNLQFYFTVGESQLWAMLLAPVMVLTICFGATIWMFLRATHSDQDPRSLHVLYLAAPYKPNYASWEVERLLRKMVLSVICTAFPVTLHPMAQLACLTCISIVSAALYLKLQPYSVAKFNDMEIGLLLTANVMVVLSLYSSAPWAGWATYTPCIRFVAGAAAILLGTGCTLWMAILIGAALMREREEE
ncbi:unnamed protein product, partial [Symbiodinium sp. CCMP2456]